MNILIIDDLVHVVKGIVAGVNWNRLNVDHVYEAFNSVEAMKLFEERTIDIMVSDIEMPMGSGLELLEWVRVHSPKTECIFLTSHSEFEYAKAAIKLGSFDYLLQPIRYSVLEKVIEKAIVKVTEDNKKKNLLDYGIYWQENQASIREKFWLDIFKGHLGDNIENVRERAGQIHLDVNQIERYDLLLIHLLKQGAYMDDDIKGLMKEWIERELVKQSEGKMIFDWVQVDSDKVAIVKSRFEASNDNLAILEEPRQISLQEKINDFIEFTDRDLNVPVACYLASNKGIEVLGDSMDMLVEMASDNVAGYRKIFLLENYEVDYTTAFEIPKLKSWGTYIENGENERVIQEVGKFLGQLCEEEKLDAGVLFKFHQEFMQEFYHVVEMKKFDTQQIFRSKEVSELYQNSLNSVEHMMGFIEYILGSKYDQRHVEIYYESSVDKLKEYISNNLEKDLSRNSLAQRVYLNPDYLSRLFKKKTGISLSTYIANERITLSKDLLAQTDMTVSIIASKVGYTNFSHFSQVFKKITGSSPLEFRSIHR